MKMDAHVRGYKLKHGAWLVALALPLLAHAQPAEEAAVAELADEAPIQQVQVSARKVETASYTADAQTSATPLALSPRETPQSVSVVTLQRIEDQNLRSVTDVVNNVTGVSVNQYETNRAGFTARGFDIDNLQVDGIPTTYDQAWGAGEAAGSLSTYERVEVVRGATGLTTGAGNPSAAINLVRKHADSKQVTGWVDAGVSRWNGRQLLGDVSTPLNASGSIRARIVGEYTEGESWVDLLKNKRHIVYATISADLAEGTRLDAGYGYQDLDARAPMWGSLPYWYSDGTPARWDRSKTTAADWARWPSTYGNGFVTLTHAFANGWALRAGFNHSERRGDSRLLYLSGMPDRITGLGMSDFAGSYLTRTEQRDVNLHAGGPFTLGGRTHEAAFGYQHMRQDFRSDSRAADFGGTSSAVGDFNRWDGAAYPEPAWGAPTFYESSTTRQQAVYGVTRLHLADPLKLILGARLTDYEKEGGGLWTAPYAIRHERELTPYAGVLFDVAANTSLYASYTDIFQPQNRKDLRGDMLDPVIGRSAELGVKSEFFDGRLNASLAVFRVKQDGLAQEAGMVDRDGDGALLPETYYRAAPGATSRGLEFELSGRLAPGWNASAGYTHFRAEDAAGMDVNSIYPRRLLRLFTTYRLPGDWSGLTVGGGVNWEGRTWTRDPQAPGSADGIIEQDAFALVNLMARYEFNKQLSAQLNVNNLFDKTHVGMFAAFGSINYGAPRNASLTLRYRF